MSRLCDIILNSFVYYQWLGKNHKYYLKIFIKYNLYRHRHLNQIFILLFNVLHIHTCFLEKI